MMEPVGGMDRIVSAFMAHVGGRVQLNSPAESILVGPRGVDVRYRHKGNVVHARADFCLTCTPMHLLAGIEHNFPKEYASGFTAVPHGKLFKIGLQMKLGDQMSYHPGWQEGALHSAFHALADIDQRVRASAA